MKKLITLLLAAALMSPAAAFAEADTSDIATAFEVKGGVNCKGSVVFFTEDEIDGEEASEAKAFANVQRYVRITAGAAKVSENEDGGLFVEAIDSNDEEVDFIIDENTLVVNADGEAAELEDGAQFTAFTAWNKPTVLMLPPRYNADIIVIDSKLGDILVDADAYKADGDRYVNAANTLSIDVAETEIVYRDGEAYEGELDGKDLLVFYDVSTRSIPAQTNPIKVIVLGVSAMLSVEPAEEEKAVKLAVGDEEFDIVDINGVDMAAVRPVAEALGLEVAWDNDLQRVSVGTVQMGVSFLIGVNSYNKSKMTPFTLEAAPYLEMTEAGGVTYLPVSFFTEVLGCEAEIDNSVMTLKF